MRTQRPLAAFLVSAPCALAWGGSQPGGPPAAVSAPLDWRAEEAGVLSDHVRVTDPSKYLRAGEAYFNSDASWIIFQATPVPPEGEAPSPHYEMYAAPLRRDAEGNITGLGGAIQLSTPGSANTCGWWHPTEPGLVLFGTTFEPPKESEQPGYQRGTGRYQWAFPVEMEIVTARITGSTAGPAERLFSRPGYDAEGSWSPDGRHVLYANVDLEKSLALGRPDADLWVHDGKTGLHTLIVEAEGYDGGPFFSPCGKWITYRSDRRGDNMLQLFIAELEFDERGRITGIRREIQLTDNQHVNWAPYWHPSGRYLVYATSEVSHRNYEVFAIPALDEEGEPVTGRSPLRITHADGFDGLPVFSNDGTLVMWTSQRLLPGEAPERATSQVWIARFNDAKNDAFARGE
jgi:hypothetical protein